MRLSSGVQRFWFVVGSGLVWSALIAGLVVYFAGWQNGVLAAAILLSLTMWKVLSIKQKLLRSLPDQLEFQPVTPKDFDFQLDVFVLTEVSWDAYKGGQQKAARDRKQALRQRSRLIGMVKVTLFELNPTLEWLGNYAPKGSRAV